MSDMAVRTSGLLSANITVTRLSCGFPFIFFLETYPNGWAFLWYTTAYQP